MVALELHACIVMHIHNQSNEVRRSTDSLEGLKEKWARHSVKRFCHVQRQLHSPSKGDSGFAAKGIYSPMVLEIPGLFSSPYYIDIDYP